MTIASLIVNVAANTAQLIKDVEKIHGTLDGIGSAAKKLGTALAAAFSVTAIIGAVKSFTDLTGSLTDLSAKTGISTRELQKLKYAAEQNGGSIDLVTKGITAMGKSLIEGDKSAVGAMKRLGLSLDEVRQMEPGQAFALIADHIAKIPSPMERSTLAMQIFGKSGAELLPMMTGNFTALGEEAEKTGLILDEDVVAAGDEFGDTLGKLFTLGMALIGKVLGPFLPLLSKLAEWLVVVANAVGVVLTDAMKGLFALGQQVIGWLVNTITKFFEWAKTIPGVSKVIDLATTAFDGLKDAAITVHNKIQGLNPPTQSAATGMDRLKFSIGTTTKAHEDAAKATAKHAEEIRKWQAGVDKAEEWVRRQNLIEYHKFFSAELEKNKLKLEASGKAWAEFTKAMRDFDIMQRQALFSLGEFGQEIAIRLPPIVDKAVKDTEKWRASIGSLAQSFAQLSQVMGGTLGSVVSDIARVINAWDLATQAVKAYAEATTKGQKMAALASGVAAVGAATGSGSTASRVAGGALTGFQVGSMFGPIGMGVGAVAGAVVGLVRGLSGPTEYEKRVRAEQAAVKQLMDDAIKAAGSMENLRLKAHLVQIQIDAAFASRDPKWIGQVLDEVDQKTQKLTAAMEEYGFTWEDLPVKARQSQMIELSDTLFEKTQLLKGAGIDYNEILKRQAADYAELIRTAVRTETEIPAALRPVIEDLTEMGLLVDENGNLMKELGEVKFAETLTQGFDRVVGKLDELIDRLTHGVGGALDNLGRRSVTVPIHFAVDDIPNPGGEPGYAHGTPGLGFVDFGRATPTWLHGREAVVPEGRTGDLAAQIAAALGTMAGGSGPATVIVNGEQFDGYIIRKTRGAMARNEIPVPSSAVQRQVSYA